MYELNPERNSDFFQTDNQPTVGTNVTMVTDNHNIRQHDSLYILVEYIFSPKLS